jgi:hypothetical protein
MAELERLRNYKAPTGVLNQLLSPVPSEEDELPKDWEFEGAIEDLDVPALIGSLTKPPEEVDYSTLESLKAYNDFIKSYGDYLYETKYNIIN